MTNPHVSCMKIQESAMTLLNGCRFLAGLRFLSQCLYRPLLKITFLHA